MEGGARNTAGILKLKREEIHADPYLVWNTFIDLVSLAECEELGPKQRIAHLAFWYDSEVQNGGHLQYFENIRGAHLAETIQALDAIGAFCQKHILQSNAFADRNFKP